MWNGQILGFGPNPAFEFLSPGFRFPTLGFGCANPALIPQTDLSVGVLAVLVKGPWSVSHPVDAAGEHFVL